MTKEISLKDITLLSTTSIVGRFQSNLKLCRTAILNTLINYQQFREDIHTSATLNIVTGSVNELVERCISQVGVYSPLIT